MSLIIIQWTIRGYINNYSELQIIRKKYHPQIIALQETHLHSLNNIPIPINYTLYSNNYSPTYGGEAILIHNSIQNYSITLPNDFDATGIEAHSIKKMKIISAYIPPTKPFTKSNLLNVINTNSNMLILGDFNSWGSLWGSPKYNQRGKTLTEFIINSNFIVLNDKSPTHFSTHNTYTHIDVSCCSPDIFPFIKWQICNDLHGSDYYPILITLSTSIEQRSSKSKPIFKLNLTDWNNFQIKTNFFSIIVYLFPIT